MVGLVLSLYIYPVRIVILCSWVIFRVIVILLLVRKE